MKRNIISIKSGFTLIELITVVIIIAILVALALPQYTRLVERSQGSAAMSGLDTIRKAEAMYFTLNYLYTSALTSLTSELPEVAKITNTTLNKQWNFSATTDSKTFTATATRSQGVYSAKSITLNSDGQVGGTHPSVDNTQW